MGPGCPDLVGEYSYCQLRRPVSSIPHLVRQEVAFLRCVSDPFCNDGLWPWRLSHACCERLWSSVTSRSTCLSISSGVSMLAGHCRCAASAATLSDPCPSCP